MEPVVNVIKEDASDSINGLEEPNIDVKIDPCKLSINPSTKVELGINCCSEDVNIERQSSSTVSKTRKRKKKKLRQPRRRQVMGSQARELIAMIYQHMKKEALNGVKNVTDARKRTAMATGVSEKTVSRILKEKRKADETGVPMSSPHRNKKPRKCLRRDMEENEEIIRQTIKNYEKEFNKPPTLQGLKNVLSERIDFKGCIETLRRILNKIGYEFYATKYNKYRYGVLVEEKFE